MKKQLTLILALLLLIGCKDVSESSKPNIVLILADDLGYNDLSCYRNYTKSFSNNPPTSQTPNIDLLAMNGMQFTNFYCGAAVCSPSRAALLTGRNSTRVGIYNWIPTNSPMHLRAEEITIAEILKAEGYQTGHFGKWHLTSEGTNQPLPNDQGFDYSFFTFNNAMPSQKNPINYYRNGEKLDTLNGYACQLVVSEAIDWIKSKKNNSKPFYINIWYNEPHVKVAAPQELTKKHSYNQSYYGAIENLDIATGKLVSFLKENNLDKNTIVIFSSDNGSRMAASNDPLRGKKAFNYEGGVRVPFIIKWPGHIPTGKISETIGSFTDILPSIAKITGVSLPKNRKLDGQDLSTVFMGRNNQLARSKPIFFYRYFHDPICMLREENWILLGYDELIPYQVDYNQLDLAKLKPEEGEDIWSMWDFQLSHMDYLKALRPKYFELYNNDDDIGQKKDLSKEYPDVVKRMKYKMLELQLEMIKEGGDWFGNYLSL